MNEQIILHYVKKDLCKMIIETEQKIQEWENKKEEVLKKNPNHRFSELRSLKQNCFTYKLLVNELNDAKSLQDVTNNFYKIREKFIEEFPQVKELGYAIDMIIPTHVIYTLYSNYGDNPFKGLDDFEIDENDEGYKKRMEEAKKFAKEKEREREQKNTEIDLLAYGIVCLENGLTFKHHSNAANYVGLKSGNSILKCCKGEQKTSGKHPETGEKLHWMYYKEYEMLTKEEELKN